MSGNKGGGPKKPIGYKVEGGLAKVAKHLGIEQKIHETTLVAVDQANRAAATKLTSTKVRPELSPEELEKAQLEKEVYPWGAKDNTHYRKSPDYYNKFDGWFKEPPHDVNLWAKIVATLEAVDGKFKSDRLHFKGRLDKMIDTAEFITDGLRQRALKSGEGTKDYQAMEKYLGILKSMRAQRFVGSKYSKDKLALKHEEMVPLLNEADVKMLYEASTSLLKEGISAKKT